MSENAIMMGCTCGKIDLERKVIILKNHFLFRIDDAGINPTIHIPTQAVVMFRCRSCQTTNEFETVNIEYREDGDD